MMQVLNGIENREFPLFTARYVPVLFTGDAYR